VDPVGIGALAYGELFGDEGSGAGRSLLIGSAGTLYVGAPGGARVYVSNSAGEGPTELEAAAAKIERPGATDFGVSLAELPGESELRLLVGSPGENTVVRIENPSRGGLADYVPGSPTPGFQFAFLGDGPSSGDETCGYALATGLIGADGGDGVIVGCPNRASGGFSLTDSAWTADVPMSMLGSRLGVGVADNENFGVSIDIGDFNGDGIQDAIIGASHDDLAGGSNCGGAYLYFGPFSDTELYFSPDGIISGSEPDDSLGAFVGTAPDLDGDGVEDLLIATDLGWNSTDEPLKSGALLVLSGATFEGTVTEGDALVTLLGTELGAQFGYFAAVVPDVDGDGSDELLVSAFNSDVLSTDGGAVYAVSGPWTGGTRVVPGVAPAIYGESSAQLGISMAVGDILADGSVDIAISEHGVDTVWLIEPEVLFGD
jgi:hypothetical protein